MIYCSHRLKSIMLLSFNYTIKCFLENMTLETKKLCGMFSHINLGSLFKLSLQLTVREIKKGKAELLIDSFLKDSFLPQAQIKFYSLKFL